MNKKTRSMHHSNHWATPADFYELLNAEFQFDFDPCPLFADFDGLVIEWGERNYINPPYERKAKQAFIEKSVKEKNAGKLCVMLLPVSTSTRAFHEMILPNMTEIRFVKGRLSFIKSEESRSHGDCGMHDSMLIIFDGRKPDPVQIKIGAIDRGASQFRLEKL